MYVDPFFQNNLIGKALITFAIENYKVNYLWALEKNTKAISFYQKYGFHITKYRKFEEDTTEYLIKLERLILNLRGKRLCLNYKLHG